MPRTKQVGRKTHPAHRKPPQLWWVRVYRPELLPPAAAAEEEEEESSEEGEGE